MVYNGTNVQYSGTFYLYRRHSRTNCIFVGIAGLIDLEKIRFSKYPRLRSVELVKDVLAVGVAVGVR